MKEDFHDYEKEYEEVKRDADILRYDFEHSRLPPTTKVYKKLMKQVSLWETIKRIVYQILLYIHIKYRQRKFKIFSISSYLLWDEIRYLWRLRVQYRELENIVEKSARKIRCIMGTR